MKPIENTTGVERVTGALLGTAAAAVATALTKKLRGKPKTAKRAKRKPTRTKQGRTGAATAAQEVHHG
jgi:hypothetical protein